MVEQLPSQGWPQLSCFAHDLRSNLMTSTSVHQTCYDQKPAHGLSQLSLILSATTTRNVCIGAYQTDGGADRFSLHHWSLCEVLWPVFHGSLGRQSLVTLLAAIQFEPLFTDGLCRGMLPDVGNREMVILYYDLR